MEQCSIVTVVLNYFLKVDSHWGRLSNPIRKSNYIVSDTLIFQSEIERSCHSVEFDAYHLLPRGDLQSAKIL